AQEMGEPSRGERPGPAEGDERVIARVEAPLHADLADRVGLIPRRDLENPLRRPQRVEAEGPAETRQAALRGVAIERDLAAEQMRRDASQHEVRVGGR